MNATEVAGVPGRGLGAAGALRSGPLQWFRSVGLMLRFDAGRAREWAGMMAIVQVMMGAGMAIDLRLPLPRDHPDGRRSTS